MFRVIKEPEFEAAVPVEAPDGSTQTLRTRFRALPVAELRAVEIGAAGLADLLDRAVLGFADLADASGAPVDAGDWRGQVLALPWGPDRPLPALFAGILPGAGGKLAAFGRAWADGGLSDGGGRLEEDCRRFGLLPPPAEAGFGLWSDCAAVAAAFLAVQTQWRVDGGAPVGLDYAGVAAGLAGAGLALGPDGWRALRAIEAGALAALSARAAEGG